MLVVCIVLLSSDSLRLLVLLLSHQCFLLALLKFIFQVFQIALHLSELKLLLQLLLFFLLHLFFESLLIVDGSHNCVDFVFNLKLCFFLSSVLDLVCLDHALLWWTLHLFLLLYLEAIVLNKHQVSTG